MADIMQMAGIAMVGGILLIFLRERTPAISFCLSVLLVTVLFLEICPKLTMAMDAAKSLFVMEHSLLSLLLRSIGISYVTQITAGLLSGAGEEGAAKVVMMAGNASLAVLALEPAAHVLRAAEALLS